MTTTSATTSSAAAVISGTGNSINGEADGAVIVNKLFAHSAVHCGIIYSIFILIMEAVQ